MRGKLYDELLATNTLGIHPIPFGSFRVSVPLASFFDWPAFPASSSLYLAFSLLPFLSLASRSKVFSYVFVCVCVFFVLPPMYGNIAGLASTYNR